MVSDFVIDDQGSCAEIDIPACRVSPRSIEVGSQSLACPSCRQKCDTHTADNLTVCGSCGHIFQTDMNVTVSYDAYYAHQYDSRPVQEMSEVRWNFIQSCLQLPKGSRVLDVGYGNGAFLKHARAEGMDIYGIDLHDEDFGIPVVNLETKIHFDLICFFDSLEHFTNFQPLRNLRASNVIVSIPNTPSWLLSSPRIWRHYKPGEHLHYFSRCSLDNLMRDWGFGDKLTDGYPEDALRGKLTIEGQVQDNIYTAIYSRA